MKQVWITDKGTQCDTEAECIALDAAEASAAEFFTATVALGARNTPSYRQAVALIHWARTGKFPSAYR